MYEMLVRFTVSRSPFLVSLDCPLVSFGQLQEVDRRYHALFELPPRPLAVWLVPTVQRECSPTV